MLARISCVWNGSPFFHINRDGFRISQIVSVGSDAKRTIWCEHESGCSNTPSQDICKIVPELSVLVLSSMKLLLKFCFHKMQCKQMLLHFAQKHCSAIGTCFHHFKMWECDHHFVSNYQSALGFSWSIIVSVNTISPNSLNKILEVTNCASATLSLWIFTSSRIFFFSLQHDSLDRRSNFALLGWFL